MIKLWDIFRYFLILGTIGFGGPIALASHMKSDLVDGKGWLTKEEYLSGLAIATALPGPVAFQLGIYCGWIRRGIIGGLVAGFSFILSPFLLCLLLGLFYQRFRSFDWMNHLFYGIAPVIMALLWNACFKLGQTTITDKKLLWLATVAFVVAFFFKFNFIYLLLIAGLTGALLYGNPSRKLFSLTWPLFIFFFKTGLFNFGSGLAIVPFLQHFVVDQYHWISQQAFLDSVAVGMMTPGPVLITATMVGFLTEGLRGAAVATAGIFLPSFVLIFVGAPLLRRYQHNTHLQGFIKGITAAMIAVIAASIVGLTHQTCHDIPTALLGLAAFFILQRWKIADPILVIAGGLVGLLHHF